MEVGLLKWLHHPQRCHLGSKDNPDLLVVEEVAVEEAVEEEVEMDASNVVGLDTFPGIAPTRVDEVEEEEVETESKEPDGNVADETLAETVIVAINE